MKKQTADSEQGDASNGSTSASNNGSNNGSNYRSRRRVRRFPTMAATTATTTLLAVASSMAMMSSSATSSAFAFQNGLPHCHARPQFCHHSSTARSVVTDPSDLVKPETPNGQLSANVNALEDAFLLSTPAHVGLIQAPQPRSQQTRGRGRPPKTMPQRTQSHNKSSTMPGFIGRNAAVLDAYNRDIHNARTRGNTISKAQADAIKDHRRKTKGQAMYETSASVPESLMRFANEIHMEDRITSKEELALGEKAQEAIRLQSLYDNLCDSLDRDPTDEEWCAAAGKINMEAISQAIDEGLEAKNKLVTSNLRMVQGVVNIYIRNGLGGQYNAGDLMQEGIMALIRAAEKYDPKRGFRFSTYAMYWIRSAVKRNQLYQSRVIPIPQRFHELEKRLHKLRIELEQSLDRPPTDKELAEAAGITELQIQRCAEAMSQRCFSLDQSLTNKFKPNNHNSQANMHDIIASQADDAEALELDRLVVREDLISMVEKHLTREEATLVLLRYGLKKPRVRPARIKSEGPLTVADVSRAVDMKPDKVRRIINRSLIKLKAIIGKDLEWYERFVR